jgi:hypothetical protein
LVGPVEAAEAALPNRGTLSANHDRGARISTSLDPAPNDVIDLGKSCGGHTNRARRFDGQSVAAMSTGTAGGES